MYAIRSYYDVDGERLHFRRGESILTEYSYKYGLEQFASVAAPYFHVEKVWTDARSWFSVQYLTRVSPARALRA